MNANVSPSLQGDGLDGPRAAERLPGAGVVRQVSSRVLDCIRREMVLGAVDALGNS